MMALCTEDKATEDCFDVSQCIQYSTAPILPQQPFLHLSLRLGQKNCSRATQGCWPRTDAAILVSLLAPPALPRCEFAAAASAMPRCHHRRFLCKNGCLVCSWLLLTTCREHACPAVGKTVCYQQMGEDRWEGWWKVTGYGQNASTSIARRNTISLPAVTIE